MSEDLNQTEKFKIKNRESWFKMIIFSAFSIAILVKIIESPFKIDLSNLSFTDVLSLFLALFSIGISAAFYFKASDTSNEFYNNTYKFTQEMSRLLERIDSGFGEKLNNISQSQGQIVNSLKNNNGGIQGSSEKPKIIEEPQEPTTPLKEEVKIPE